MHLTMTRWQTAEYHAHLAAGLTPEQAATRINAAFAACDSVVYASGCLCGVEAPTAPDPALHHANTQRVRAATALGAAMLAAQSAAPRAPKPRKRLSRYQVEAIRDRRHYGEDEQDLAREFGVSENTIQKIAGGGAEWVRKVGASGEANPAAKLSQAQVDAIRERRARGESHRVLAREFGIARRTVRQILSGARWGTPAA